MVLIGHELAVAGEILERLVLELGRITLDVIEHPRLEDEEGAVDPRFTLERLLIEARYLVVLDFEPAVARGRPYRRHRRGLAVMAMEFEQLLEVDIGHPIAPGEHEGRVSHVGFQPLDTAAGVGRQPGVDEIDFPVLAQRVAIAVVVWLDVLIFERDAQVGGQRAVVGHVAFDVLALVAEGYDELLMSVRRVVHHDVPENRAAADLDHRFRFDHGLFGQSRAETSCEDAYLHMMLSRKYDSCNNREV